MGRGELRIYLGAAAGVGKTYAMLNEGRRRRDYGEDVVVGLVESHGRAKTAAQVGDLEVVPRARFAHRGATFEDLDVDAVLARRPQVALVDELAHTNVPGARNEKRWQDVEELLDAGITVISTLNVQHLESLNDVVEQITLVKQRETIPDEVVRRADELQLVDLTPLALRNRLARGDVYSPERIDVALANYFRPGNLSALRELALAWLADRVDEGLEEYRRRHGIEEPWETRERVLVALTGSIDGERLVRRAARIAQRSKGDLVAVHVIAQSGLAESAPGGGLLATQRALVEELGGAYHEVVGADVGEALLDTARALNVTQIVMGATRRSPWQRLMRGSVIGRVIRKSGTAIDVHVISHPEAVGDEAPGLRRVRPSPLPRRRRLLGVVLAAAGLPILTVLLSLASDGIELTSVMLLFLLLVTAVAAVGGLGPALAAAVAAFGLVNWYFVEPRRTITIAETEEAIALVAFVAVGVLVSALVALAARRAAEGARARAEAEALSRLAGATAAGAVLDGLRRVLGLEGASVLRRREQGWQVEASSGDRAPDGTDTAASTIELGPEHLLALGGPPIHAEDQRVLEAFVRELRASVHVGELEAEAETVGALAAANELRTAILSAVSHDLRTPIAAIKASVTSLLQHDVEWTPDARQEFLETIDEETDRLNALVGNLLGMSRIQAGALELEPVPVGLDEVLPAALRSIGAPADAVQLFMPEPLPAVLADRGLLERALANVLANALRFSPLDTPVRVSVGAVDGMVDVRVADTGPGVPASERARLFLPFQRFGDAGQSEGVGLGLAVAKGFVEAMGGEIEADDTPGGGLTIALRLRGAA